MQKQQQEKLVGAKKRKMYKTNIFHRITNQMDKLQISEPAEIKGASQDEEVTENQLGNQLRSITPASETDSGFNASEDDNRIQQNRLKIMERPKRITSKANSKLSYDEIIEKFLEQSTVLTHKEQLQPRVILKRLTEFEQNIENGNWHVYLKEFKPKFKVLGKRTTFSDDAGSSRSRTASKVEYYISWNLKISQLQEDGWFTRDHVENLLKEIEAEFKLPLFPWNVKSDQKTKATKK